MPEFIPTKGELPIDSKFDIVAETEEFLLINKSGNIPVHESGRYQENTLTRILEPIFGKIFPVYRLDRETSGLILFAKKTEFVDKLFSNICDKEYVAIVEGVIDKSMILDFPIGETVGKHVTWKKCVDSKGKEAITLIFPIKSFENKTLIRVVPKTGRQHQIRVHLAHIKHPIVNDKIYGDDEEKFVRYLKGEILPRQMLHMFKIKIYDKTYEIRIPEDFD